MSSNGSTAAKRASTFATVDAMPGPLRACVHEFGFAIVNACLNAGVRDPARIRHLVFEIWSGARQPAQRNAKGDDGNRLVKQLDWVLLQSGCGVPAKTLIRVLFQSGMVILPRDPSDVQVQASMDAMKETGWVSNREKHRIRLRKAVDAGAKALWPHLFEELP